MLGSLGPARSESPGLVTSLYLWGQNRDEVNRLAARAAQGLDARFAWVEVSDGEPAHPSPNNPGSEISAPTSDFVPPPGVSERQIWTYLQPNGQRRDAQDLDRFVRMSEPIQRAIEFLLAHETPRVLVVANLERLQDLFCKDDVVPHPFIEWLNAHEITLIATSTGAALHEGVFFDYLITDPDSTAGAARPPIVAVCQRGGHDSSFLRRIFDPYEVVSITGPPSSIDTLSIPSASGSRG